jgi:hypothetical protein
MDDLRRSKRIVRNFPIEQLMVAGPDHPTSFQADVFIESRGLDISAGGIGGECGRPLEPLTHVFVMFKLPLEGGGRLIRADGFVAHSRREDDRTVFGIRLLEISPEDKAALEFFVATAG